MSIGTLPENTPKKSPKPPREVIMVNDGFRLTPMKAAMIAFYCRTMLGPNKKFVNTTDFISTFSETFKIAERTGWRAWQDVKRIVTQIKSSRTRKLYFAFSMDGLDYMVKQFLDAKNLL